MKVLRDLLILIVFFAAIWYVFTQLTDTSDGISVELTEKQKEQLADWMSDNVEEQYDLVENEKLDSVLNVIKERLMHEIDPRIGQIHIKVIRGDQVNAFATFGNQVYVFTGMIEFTESPEELAVIIGHEIGHLYYNHVERKFIKEVGLGLTTMILSGGDPVLASEVARTLMSTAYDRRQERESDDFALNVQDSSRLPVSAMVSVFMRINREKDTLPDELSFISTHPNLNDRIEVAAEYKRKFKETELFDLNWEEIKEIL